MLKGAGTSVAQLKAAGIVTGVQGTANEIIVNVAAGIATLSTPQPLNTLADVIFDSAQVAILQPANAPTAAIGAALGAGSITSANPLSGTGPNYCQIAITTGAVPIIGSALTLTFGTPLPGTGVMGFALFSAIGVIAARGTISRPSPNVIQINTPLALAALTSYLVDVAIYLF